MITSPTHTTWANAHQHQSRFLLGSLSDAPPEASVDRRGLAAACWWGGVVPVQRVLDWLEEERNDDPTSLPSCNEWSKLACSTGTASSRKTACSKQCVPRDAPPEW